MVSVSAPTSLDEAVVLNSFSRHDPRQFPDDPPHIKTITRPACKHKQDNTARHTQRVRGLRTPDESSQNQDADPSLAERKTTCAEDVAVV